MAIYGARNSFWAPFKPDTQDTDPTKLPAYGVVKSFGQLNKVTDNPNYNEGSLHGDDQIALYEKKFNDGTVNAESVFLPVEDAATMLGASYDDEMGMAQGDDDTPPYIGYGFVTHHVGKAGKYFQSVFYPKLKANPAGKDYETRAGSIKYATDKMEYHWESPACRKHKILKDFATEAEANAYIQALFAGTAAVPGLPAPTTEQTEQTNS